MFLRLTLRPWLWWVPERSSWTHVRRPRLLLAIAGLACALAGSGCAKPVVAAAPEPPPLVVPPVPPRLVGPVVVEEELPEPVAQVAEPPVPPPPTRPRTSRAGAEAAARPENAPEAARSEPPAEPAGSTTLAAPLLRTPDTANNTEAVRRVRDLLDRAQDNLSKVDARTLSRGARDNYRTATLFIGQAESALKTGRIDYARFLAEKADTLSTGLLKR